MLHAFRLVIARELRVAFRRWSDLALPVMFFVIVCMLFPLAVGQDQALLQKIGPGAIWVAALLATLMSLNTLYRDDFDDGTLEQLSLSTQPLTILLLAKTVAHWIVTELPLIAITPLLTLGFNLSAEGVYGLMLTLLAGTPALSLLGSVGAALTAGLHQASGLIALLLLPLTIPILIFGARAADLAASGQAIAGPLYLLGGLSVLALTLCPFATAAAVRVSLD
jgi:heme exporter protein B